MRPWLLALFAVMAVTSTCGLAPLRAQGPAPQTYSLIEDPGFPIMGPEVVKIVRDGPREVVDQIMPVMPGRPKEYHGHLLYDFQAHKLYTQVLSDPGTPCGVQEYNDPAAPAEFDLISGAAGIQKELTSKGQTKQAGMETVNGFATNVMEFTSSETNGKIWVTQKGGYPVKVVFIDKGGKATTMIEVKQLSFAKPPASTFTLPASCASAQLPPPPAKPGPNVTAVTLEKIGNYNGACPARLKMAGSITVDGPGPVFYQFGAGTMAPGQTLTFGSAGTKTVTQTITLQPTYGNQMGGSAILEAIGIDSAGNHSLATKGSNNADFNITCSSGGGK